MTEDHAERAKLAGLRKAIEDRLKEPRTRHFDPDTVFEYFGAYAQAASTLKDLHPGLLADLPDRAKPEPTTTTDFEGRGYLKRNHLEQVVRDIDYIFEVLDYGSHKIEPPTPGRPTRTSGLRTDLANLGPIDVWRAATRLKFSSIAILLGLLLSGASAIALSVRAQYEPKLAAIAAFADAFVIQFADRDTLSSVVKAVIKEQPDGITTDQAALASLLWQVKSQAGFAEFLSGESSTAVQVTFTADSMELKWEQGTNPLQTILPNLGLDPTKKLLTRLNTELNLLGVAWLDDSNHIVRGTDGGLAIVGAEE